MKELSCPLCENKKITNFFKGRKRDYFQCEVCNLVFVGKDQWLSEMEEKKRYDLHENDIYDAGYRKFLSRIFNPIVDNFPINAKGLDFGCGPGPALAEMFKEKGYEIKLYDIFYEKKEKNLLKNYDFITITEVVEHLQDPFKVIKKLWNILKQDGILGIMTKLVIDEAAFKNWHYKDDLTHICFFSIATFNYLAEKLGAEIKFIGKDVILLKKNSDS